MSTTDDLPQIWAVRQARPHRARHHRLGVQIMDLPPDYTTASHDESDSGQQELYVDRVLTSGPTGLRVLCVGGVPGAPYVAPEWTG
jgi:hypothetical protein